MRVLSAMEPFSCPILRLGILSYGIFTVGQCTFLWKTAALFGLHNGCYFPADEFANLKEYNLSTKPWVLVPRFNDIYFNDLSKKCVTNCQKRVETIIVNQ